MFPSSSNNCDHVPFTNQATITENENPSSSQQHHHDHHHHHHSPFLHFPADQPFLADDNELFMSHLFSQHQILGCSSNNNVVAETEIKMASPVKPTKKTTTKKKKNEATGEKQAAPRKRTGKKDRHSKIYTAQGPRDRRMRLSLQIARKFFDLQDTLGFDKASKTIEWLFSKSMAAIKELTESLPSVKKSCTGGAKSTLSSTSESEVVSGIKKNEVSLVGIPRAGAMNRRSSKLRESRDKARARARERTVEKMKMRGLEFDQKSKKRSDDQEANPNDLENNCSDLNVVADQEAAAEEEDKESGMVHLPEHDDGMDSVSIIEKFLGITTSPRSSSIFDYTHNIGESSGSSSQQNHPAYSTEYNSYRAMTNMDGSSSGNNLLQAQNHPGEFFIRPDTQEREYSSIYMIKSAADAHDQNPSSDFNKAISIAHEKNPSSIVMTSQPYFLEDQFSCNPIVHNKYSSLY